MDVFASLAYDPLLDPTTPAPDINSASRKRPRSTTPTSRSNKSQKASSPVPSGSLADKLLDPVQRNGALNELLRISATNYALDGDSVLKALAEIVFECLDWDHSTQEEEPEPTFSPWKHCTQESKLWATRCQDCFSNKHAIMAPEKFRCIEAVVVILRNLSFAAANARLLAFSADILEILVGCLYEGTFSSVPSSVEDSNLASNTLTLSALHAMVNLAPHLDVTGQKLFCDKLFFTQKADEGPLVPDPSSFGLAVDGVWGFGSLWLAKRLDAKEDVMTDIPKSALLELTNAADYVIQCWAIFPALEFIFADPKASRSVLMMAVDLVQEFVNHARVGVVGSVEQEGGNSNNIPSARAILVNMPESVLNRLTDLLYIPRLGPDSLNYEDPTINIVTRVNMYKLFMTYDANVDTDVRDRALDVLVPLLELDSPRMAARMAVYPSGRVRTRLFDALVPILAGAVGRNESSMLASQLLKELAKAGKETKTALAYIQGRLLELAAKDARMSNLMFTHLYPPEPAEESDGESSEEQEGSV